MKNWHKTGFTICRVQESTSKLGQGRDLCPIEVHKEEISHLYNLDTYYKEAYIIKFIKLSNVPAKAAKSQISDDTDVFILLLHQYQIAGLKVQVTMESPNKDRAILDTA